ncbi:MAG: hypothetical protein JWQ28_1421 [Pedobacter sp.]|jgi:hypothetical protein|nr:hypothetical protein [Pedobacter sp.]
MARQKATPAPTIEQTIANKIETIRAEISKNQEQLDHWEKISNDYQTNKVTIESILAVHKAPDLAEVKEKKVSKKAAKGL